MSENDTEVWKISVSNGAKRIELHDMKTLDAITRQLPQGYYSTFRTFGERKKVLGMQAHLQRLYQPAAAHGIEPALEVNTLRKFLAEVLQDFQGEVRIRMILTEKGQVYVAIQELKPLPQKVYSQGVKVVTTDVQRTNPRLKSTVFISASKSARAEISRSNVFEALLVRNGSILEGMTSNFFYVLNGFLGTARNHILLGVTRQTVLRVARKVGLDIEYRSLKRDRVSALSEAFLTSSSRGIVPIVQIDNVPVGEGNPGPVTMKLINGYQVYVMKHAELIYSK